ncbi:hypothetical protein V8C34DRAFT_195174 [Trichoderma compactum]
MEIVSRKPSPAHLVIDRPRNETGFREPRERAPPYYTPVVDACFILFGGMVGRQGPTPLRRCFFFSLLATEEIPPLAAKKADLADHERGVRAMDLLSRVESSPQSNSRR